MLRSIPSVPAREIEACGTAMEPSTPKAKSIDCQVMGVSGPACNGAVDAPPECIARAVARSANGRGGVMFHRLSRSDHPQSRTGRPLCRARPLRSKGNQRGGFAENCAIMTCGDSAASDDGAWGRLSEGLEALAAWTGKTKVMFVSDTDTDGWDKLKFINVHKKPSNAVIGITDKGDVFGGYVSVGINGSGTFPDKGQFVFSFFANGRCVVPQRWVMKKDRENAGEDVYIWPTGFNGFGSEAFSCLATARTNRMSTLRTFRSVARRRCAHGKEVSTRTPTRRSSVSWKCSCLMARQ